MRLNSLKELYKIKYKYRDEILTEAQMRAINEDFLLEMTTVEREDSGLPYRIWLDPAGIERCNEHSNTPRIKVELKDGRHIPFEISDNPDIPKSVKKKGIETFPHINEVKKYIVAYKKILLAHYFKEISDKEALNLLGHVEDSAEAELSLNDLLEVKDAPDLISYYWNKENNEYEIYVISKDNTILNSIIVKNDMGFI